MLSVPFRPGLARLLRSGYSVLRRPQALLFLPALTLGAYWWGGEPALIKMALGLPLAWALAVAVVARLQNLPVVEAAAAYGERAIEAMDALIAKQTELGRSTGCFVIQIDDSAQILARHGRAAHCELMKSCASRLRGALRSGDMVTALEGGSLTVVLAPVHRLTLEVLIQIAMRIQSVVQQPVGLATATVQVTVSIGFCHGRRAPEPSGRSLLDAAQIAADEATLHGPGAIRAFSSDMARKKANQLALREGLQLALDGGQIKAHFQPQISTDTGEISGVETLARWYHPTRGCLAPAEFLPAIEGTGLGERLSEVMLTEALEALAKWDAAGLTVPTISVNFSAAELRDPRLPERLKWELDRYDLTTDRLTVEILETVIASGSSDMILANVAALAALGCGIDLDDFGTGHASITTIRQFALRRLKIDRSFVTDVDKDRQQQKMVAAIQTLAEQLGLETVAEGVETPAEHAMVAQLGCRYVQGYAIARPMPLAETTEWIRQHAQGGVDLPKIGHAAW